MKINIHASILSSRLSADINARLLQPCAHILNRRKVELSRSLNVSVDISRTIAVLSHQFGKTARCVVYGVDLRRHSARLCLFEQFARGLQFYPASSIWILETQPHTMSRLKSRTDIHCLPLYLVHPLFLLSYLVDRF